MTTPTCAFNATDDALYGEFLNASIGQFMINLFIGDLASVRPTQLNLTADCVSTIDLQSLQVQLLTGLNEAPNDAVVFRTAQRVQSIGPLIFQNATALSLCNYWSLLMRVIPSAQGVVQNAIEYCQAGNQIWQINAAIDYTRNCSETVRFWTHATQSLGEEYVQWGDYSELWFRSTLLPQYATLSPWTLIPIYQRLSGNQSFIRDLGEAAIKCEPAACEAIAFAGNADIAGFGALVVYGSIVFFTTVIAIGCLYLCIVKPIPITARSPAEVAFKESSLMFCDTVSGFSVMAVIAGSVYSSRGTSIYEISLAYLIAFIVGNANLILTILQIFKQDDRRFRLIFQGFAAAFSIMLSMSYVETRLVVISPDSDSKFADFDCNLDGGSPLKLIKTGALLNVSLIALWFVLVIARCCSLRLWKRSHHQTILSVIAMVAIFFFPAMCFITMWVNMAFLAKIRLTAAQKYGKSFGDNSFGYGQILASGFCLQALVRYPYTFYREWRNNRKSAVRRQDQQNTSLVNLRASLAETPEASDGSQADVPSLHQLVGDGEFLQRHDAPRRSDTGLLEHGTRKHPSDGAENAANTSSREADIGRSTLSRRDTFADTTAQS